MSDLVRWYIKKQGTRFSTAGAVGAAVLLVFAIHHVVTVLSFASGSFPAEATVTQANYHQTPEVVFTGIDGNEYTVRLQHWLSAEHYPEGTVLQIYVRNDEPWRVLERTSRTMWRRPVSFVIYAALAAVASLALSLGVRKVEELEQDDLSA